MCIRHTRKTMWHLPMPRIAGERRQSWPTPSATSARAPGPTSSSSWTARSSLRTWPPDRGRGDPRPGHRVVSRGGAHGPRRVAADVDPDPGHGGVHHVVDQGRHGRSRDRRPTAPGAGTRDRAGRRDLQPAVPRAPGPMSDEHGWGGDDHNITLDAGDDDWEWRRKIRSNPHSHLIYRIVVG